MADYLMHFNPFHDPKNGQFTSGGSSSSLSARKVQRKLNKISVNDKLDRYERSKLSDRDSKQHEKYHARMRKLFDKNLDLRKKYDDSEGNEKERILKALRKLDNKALTMKENEHDRRAKYQRKISDYDTAIENSKKTTQELLSYAKDKGYTVNSKKVTEWANEGKITAGLVAGFLTGNAAVAFSGFYDNAVTQRVKYSVKK